MATPDPSKYDLAALSRSTGEIAQIEPAARPESKKRVTLTELAAKTQQWEEMSAQCPACNLHELVLVQLTRGEDGRWRQLPDNRAPRPGDLLIDTCPVCFGGWFDPGEFDVIGNAELRPEELKDSHGDLARRLCPRGHGAMIEHKVPELLRTPIDVCPTCRGVWLDGDERKKLALATTEEGQQSKRKRIAKRGVIWAVQMITQLPVEVENPARGTPWLIYSLLALQLFGFLLSVFGIFFYKEWAVIAGQIRAEPVHVFSLFTHQFFHANWFHLLGNAYFLYIFGDNIEHLFGRLRFIVLFVGAGCFGAGMHTLLTTATATPVIGASGAIAGVMAAYLWSFPNAKLFQVIPFTPIQLKIPAWVYLGVWVAFQAVMALFSQGMDYAWYAHLGGFIFGLGYTPLVLRWRRRTVSKKVRVPAARYAPA